MLIANEIVDEKRCWSQGVVFKIDFEKTYDNVDWGFLNMVQSINRVRYDSIELYPPWFFLH